MRPRDFLLVSEDFFNSKINFTRLKIGMSIVFVNSWSMYLLCVQIMCGFQILSV
jgi:hypothetical protein